MTDDRCPGALRLHDAADGALARVRLPGGRLPLRALESLAGLAELGNGIVELTSRGNLQVRGLPASAGSEVARRLADGGLLPSLAHDRVRNLLASPLGARHPDAGLPTDALVDALDAGIRDDPALADLSGRFLFAVEDASATLGPHDADVTLVPTRDGRVGLRLAGRPTTLAVPVADAPGLALGVAHAFLGLARGAEGRTWRIRDLDRGAERVAAQLGGALAAAGSLDGAARPAPGRPLAVGVLPQADGRVALTTLPPLGRLSPAVLRALATIAPGDDLRVSPARTITLTDVAPDAVAATTSRLDQLGLVVRADTGWAGLTACAGAGACANARADVRSAAAQRAAARRPGDVPEHWSACERACGRPSTGVAVVATADGIAISRPDGDRVVPSLSDTLHLLSLPRPEVLNA
jgi:precorrin-3B synthase